MKRKERLPELLAPAGSPEALYAAVEAGADAVYLGLSGETGNARIGARNFSLEELKNAVPYCHGHGVKVYLTLNTLLYDGELPSFLSLAREAADAGVDAFIVADLGLASLLSQEIPDVPLHASTQAFAHSTDSVDALYGLGFERVVVARELSREDIRSVTENAKAEIEIFIHGAMCVSHSGQCLFSSIVGGRSGNRGVCAQPCRLPYAGGKYPLSLKDMCLASHIPELCEMGVSSLKIEGRIKPASYVYTVTRIYRRLLDEGRAPTDAETDELRRAFSRSGFTDGYYKKQLDRTMMGIRTEADKEASRTEEAPKGFSPIPLPVKADAVIQRDMPSRLSLSLTLPSGDTLTARAEGMVPLAAENAGLTADAVKERLSKTGGTGFEVTAFSLALADGLFLPVGAQNALRREATEKLTKKLSLYRRKNEVHPLPRKEHMAEKPLKTAAFYSIAPYVAAATNDRFDAVFLPLEYSLHLREHMANGVILPPVVTDGEENEISAMLYKARERGARYALVSSLGAITLAKRFGLIPVGDFRLNVTNRASAALYRSLGVRHIILSPELSPARAAAIGGGQIAYGRIPLMLTEKCFIKDTFGCEACGKASLIDRRGASFPVLPIYHHRCIVFNSLPTYLGDKPALLRGDALSTHMIFTTESAKEISAVLSAFDGARPLGIAVRRAYK